MLSFGQYRNQSLKDIIEKDRQYLEWLNTQPWFKIKYGDLYLETSKILIKPIDPTTLNTEKFIIYTDGACSNNGSKNARGGVGVHFNNKNKIKIPDISSKLIINTPTNNAAELIAIECAINKCIEYNVTIPIIIYTDSDYSIKCIKYWYPQWVKNNNLSNKKNLNILERINKIIPDNLEFIHIRAQHDTKLQDEHSIGNQKADKLAVEGINK